MSSFSVRLAWRLSFTAIVGGSGALFLFIGAWALPVTIALAHGGFAEVARLGTTEAIFAAPPAFLELKGRAYELFKAACGIVAMFGFALGATVGTRYWRHLVVSRGWMTAEDAKAFAERKEG